ncbi:glycosyltransferase 87 family protein [Actinomycetota bacterium]
MTDRFAERSLTVAGGPLGRHASARARGLPALLATLFLGVAATMALGVVQRGHCIANGWSGTDQFSRMCFSDLVSQYELAQLSTGVDGWLDGPGRLDQPPLTAAVMALLGGLTPGAGADASLFYFLTWAVLATGLLMAVVWSVASAVPRTAGYAAHVAFSPVVALATLLSADVVGVALASLGLWAWVRRRPVLAGVLLGLAVMARTYPLLILLAILLVAGREERRGDSLVTLVSAALSALLTALPLLALAPEALLAPYRAWWSSPAGLGTIWKIPDLLGHPLPVVAVTALAVAGWLAAIVVGVTMSLRRMARPSVAEIALVMVALVSITGKSYPIQAALWLVPLIALAGLRWRDHLVWAAGEALHFVALWLHMSATVKADRGLPPAWYLVFLVLRVLAVGYLMWQAAEGGYRRVAGGAHLADVPAPGTGGPVREPEPAGYASSAH